MIITFKDQKDNELVQVRSMSDGLNYQIYLKPVGIEKNGKLYTKNGKEIKRDWCPQQCYAQDLAHAIRLALEQLMLLNDEEIRVNVTPDIKKDIVKAVRQLINKKIAVVMTEVNRE